MWACKAKTEQEPKTMLTLNITRAVLAHDACVIFFVCWPLVDKHGRV